MIKFALYEPLACISLFKPSGDISTLSIDPTLKLEFRAFSISLHLKTPFSPAPVTATATPVAFFAIKTPTIAYLDAGLGNLIYEAFSGIGNHKTFIDMLKNNKLKIIDSLEYPDHYQYSKKDLNEIIYNAKKHNAKIITTEKDYLRLDGFNKDEIYFIKSNLEILDENNFIKKLIELNEKS